MNGKSIICPVLHGVEFDNSGYFDKHYQSDMYEFIKGIQKYLTLEDRQRIHFRPINWNVLVSEKERKTWELTKDCFWSRIVKLVCFGGCDILWYANTQRTPEKGDVFKDIQDLIKQDIDYCQQVYGDSDIVMIGHSWGTQISLDFAFDGFVVDGLITMGSPILYGSGRFHDWGEPPEHLKFWVNFRSRFDPVATAISRNPNPKFAKIVKDIDVSSWFKMLPLLAHTSYWKSDKVFQETAKVLLSL